MIKARAFVLAALSMMLIWVSLAYPADINGKWKGSFEGPQGSIEMSFSFKVDGEKISGTMTDPMMGEAQISEGALKGNDISFTISGNGPMGEMKINFKGKVTGADEIKLNISFGGGDRGGPDGGPGEGPGGDRGGPGGMEITIKRAN